MGAGISQKSLNGMYYRRLKAFQRELLDAGVQSNYSAYALTGNGEAGEFAVFYGTLRASNGETAGMLKVVISSGGKVTESFGKHFGEGEKGLARVKELFGKKPEPVAPYDVTGGIIAYEQGDLDEDETIELFQHLVNTGLAWQLQGHYGRTAAGMIEAGLITRGGK